MARVSFSDVARRHLKSSIKSNFQCAFSFRISFSGSIAALVAMAVSDEDKRAYIALNVSADLQYVCQDNHVSLQNQYLLSQHYKTLKVFSTFCDTRAEVRTALKDDFCIDQATDAPTRAEVARMMTSWEVARSKSCVVSPRFWVCHVFCNIQRDKLC